METKQHHQKTPTTKKLDLDLDAFLHSVICLSIKDINKQFIFNHDFLDFNLISKYFKSHVFPCMNRTILDIIFKFIAGLNM
jgi:hypothetical protein